MRILFFLLLLSPICASAQILRAYGVIEVGSFPTSSATGPKFAYRPADSSFYRWVSGSTWVKIIPDEPDTLYLKQLSGTTALVDGDTIDISTYFLKSDTTSAFASYLKRPVGWGLSLLTGKYPFVDSSKVASRYYAGTNPTIISANYIATSNGTNLVARNLFDNNTYVGILNSKPVIFGSQAVAGLPTGVDGYWLDVSNYKWLARYNSTAGAWIYPLQSSLAGGVSANGRVFFGDVNGRATATSAVTISGGTLNATTFVGSGMQIYGNAQFFSGGTVQFFNTGNTASASFQFANAYNLLSVNRGIIVTDLNPNAPGGPISSNWPASNMPINGGRGTGNSTTGDIVFATATALGSGNAVQTLTNRWWVKHTSGRLSNNSSPSYILDVQGTDAIRVPVGTVAQTPTETVGILRYNSDSTAYQGYAGSSRIFFATRAYARSLVSALPTTNIYTANGSLTSNRILMGGTYNLTLNSKVKIGLDSSFSHDPTTNITSFKGDMAGDSASITITGYGNGVPVIVQQNPVMNNAYATRTFVSDSQFGAYTNSAGFAFGHAAGNDKVGFQWDKVVRYDSVSSASWEQQNLYGPNFLIASHLFKGGGVGMSGGEFNFLTRTSAASNSIAFRVYNGSIDFFSVRSSGQTIIKNRLTGADFFLSDPIGDSTLIGGKVTLNGLGTGTATAILGRTSANKVVPIALNTEQYNTITSTTSPQTLSSTTSDNFINQGSTQATFTFRLPASPVDGQISKATFANAVTVLTIDGNGTTVSGTLPTTAAVATHIVFKNYSGIGWIRQY